MKTISLDNKTWIQGKAILLPTEDKINSLIVSSKFPDKDKSLHYIFDEIDRYNLSRGRGSGRYIYYHLYITNDSEIKVNNIVYNTLNSRIGQVYFREQIGNHLKKVIATTNPKIRLHNNSGKNHCFGTQLSGTCRHTLPQISEEFIKQWINNPQEDVLIEVESDYEIGHEEYTGYGKVYSDYKTKTSSDNTVNLRFVGDDDWDSIYQEYVDKHHTYPKNYSEFINYLKENFNPPTRKEK